MTTETMTPAVETIASTEVQPIAKKAVKNAVKSVAKKAANLNPVIKAKPAPKLSKVVVKKTAKKTAKTATTRAQHTFILATKADLANFGSGQRFAIAKLIKKGATRTDLIAKLPDVSAANISWHLSMMVKNGEAKKVATK